MSPFSRSITVTFNGPVSFAGGNASAAAAFQLQHVQTSGNVGLTAAVSTDSQGRTAVTLTFSGSETDPVSALNGGAASYYLDTHGIVSTNWLVVREE